LIVSILMLFIQAGDPEPMKVVSGDPALNVAVRTLDGQPRQLEHLLDTSLCWVLSTECRRCREAYIHINTLFANQYRTVILFPDGGDQVEDFLAENKPNAAVYLVEPSTLEPYSISTVPALLLYRKSRLAYAFHGPVHKERAH